MSPPTPSPAPKLNKMSSLASMPALARALSELPQPSSTVRSWRILLLVSAVNSLTQRVATHLEDMGFTNVSIELALTDDDMYGAVIAHSPHVVLCPFLVKKVPDQIFQNVITLIVHPGPPGDAGPAALDWAILGDRGIDDDSSSALSSLLQPLDRSRPLPSRQRTHWGITVLQADETLDGGPVWAYDQFPLPDITTVTKSYLYQNQVSNSVLRAVTVALCRIGASFETHCDPANRATWMSVRADPRWATECVSYASPFMGGKVHDRPQIKPGQRRPKVSEHTAADVARIVNCGDSQPGGTIATTKSFLFVYDAHMHLRASDLPATVRERFDAVAAGEVVATREGAVLFKTTPVAEGSDAGIAIWLTHGRVPKAANSGALNPKVPMAEAMTAAGEGAKLEGAPEWVLEDFTEKEGTWQQVFVRTIGGDKLTQLVYWDFYNGAFSTTGCKLLLRGLQWAADPARGAVSVLALMGGQYFSNGVALNIIEAASHPGHETWANINAIDDVVEFLAGDLSTCPRSPFLSSPSLTERGIVSVACVRGNAAAGGVALAAACDIVIAGNTVVLNPAYRAMGLHGSEFHLYSYVERCGRDVATHLVRDMLPLSASHSRDLGLVDIVVGGRDATKDEVDAQIVSTLKRLAAASNEGDRSWLACAPWVRDREIPRLAAPSVPARPGQTQTQSTTTTTTTTTSSTLVARLCANKAGRYASPSHIPLLHYRNEELSQMLLDNFHPIRSERYHSRRIKFVRKVKAGRTANRFVKHRLHASPDEEETAAFDAAPGWVRGEEWGWVGLPMPDSMKEAYSEGLRIDFGAHVAPMPGRRGSAAVSHRSRSTDDSSLHTAHSNEEGHHSNEEADDTLLVSSVSATAINGMPMSSGGGGFFTSKLRPKSKKPTTTAPTTPAKQVVSEEPSPPRASVSGPIPPPKSLRRLSSSSKAPRASLQIDNRRPSTSAGDGPFGKLTSRRASKNASTFALPNFSDDVPPVPPMPAMANTTPTSTPRKGATTTPANTPAAGNGTTTGRFATLRGLLKPKRETKVTSTTPTPALTPVAARTAPAPTPTDELKYSGPATTYDRPVIPNEGDTESPCLYNVTQDLGGFPTLPRNAIQVTSA